MTSTRSQRINYFQATPDAAGEVPGKKSARNPQPAITGVACEARCNLGLCAGCELGACWVQMGAVLDANRGKWVRDGCNLIRARGKVGEC